MSTTTTTNKKPIGRLSRRSRSLGDAHSPVFYGKDENNGGYTNTHYDNILTSIPNGTSRSLSPNHHHPRRRDRRRHGISQGFKSLSPSKWMKKFKSNRSKSVPLFDDTSNNDAVWRSHNDDDRINQKATRNHHHSHHSRHPHDSNVIKKTVLSQQQRHYTTNKTRHINTSKTLQHMSNDTTSNHHLTYEKRMEEVSSQHPTNNTATTNHVYPNDMDTTTPNQIVNTNNKHNPTSITINNNNEDDSSACTQETNVDVACDETTSRLTTIVWKRKSGFSGKMKSGYVKASEKANELSMKSVSNLQKLTQTFHPGSGGMGNNNAVHSPTSQQGNSSNVGSGSGLVGPPTNIKIWEERRILLEGGILMYYHKDADLSVIDESEAEECNGNAGGIGIGGGSRSSIMSKNKNLAKLKHKFIEFSQGTKNSFNLGHHHHHQQNNTSNTTNSTSQPTTEINASSSTKSNSAINTPRGLIDLVATGASASVTHLTQFSHAPTPYSLSINVKNETKWVLCFTSSKELLNWLGALTDISLKQSVQSYEMDHGHSYLFDYDFDDEDIEKMNYDSKKSKEEILDNDSKHSIGSKGSSAFHETTANDDDNVKNTNNDNEFERREALDELTPLLGPEPKFNVQQRRSCNPNINSCAPQGPYSTMAIFNGAVLSLLFLMNNASTTILVAQSVMNGLVWSYYYYTNKKPVGFVGDDDDDNGSDIPVNATSSSTNAIKSCMTPSGSKISMRGRSFSSGDYDMKEKPSFVEVTKDDPEIVIRNEPPFKPSVGETMVQFQNESEAMNYKGDMIGYISAPSSILQVRGSHYLSDKKKVPSPTSLYELVQVDGFDSDQHMLDVGTKFNLSELQCDSPKGPWRAPDLLVISFALPTSPPKIGKASDNKGYIVVGYYKMRQATREILQILSNNNLNSEEKEEKLHELYPNENERFIVNGVKLWEKWCQCAPTDQEMQKRLKFIPRGENLKEVGVPGWICKYNGKPMLIKRPGVTNFVYSHQDENMMEIDVNMHPLPYMFRQAMTYLKEHYFQRIVMTFGFVIEGRESDELPEVLLGNPLQLPYVNPANVVKSGAVFDRPSF